MSRRPNYLFHEGGIWMWVDTDWYPVSRELAGRILVQFNESALVPDYFQARAAELRDDMAEAIRQYDQQFNTRSIAA